MKQITNLDEVLSPLHYPAEMLRSYINYQDQFYEAETSRVNKEMDNATQGMDYRNAQGLRDNYQEFILNFLEATFKDIHNKSLLLTLFSVYELYLKQICNAVAVFLNNPPNFSNKKLFDCQEFLSKHLQEPIFESEEANKINLIKKIRNKIVHEGSNINFMLKYLDKKEKKMLSDKSIKSINILTEFMQMEGFVIVDNGVGLLSSEFLFYVIDLMVNFLEELKVSIITSQKSLSN